MNNKIRFFFLFGGMISALLSGCIKTESPKLINNYTDFQVLSVKEYYPDAKAAAAEWQNDAYLYRVSLTVFPREGFSTLLASYFFRSNAYPEKYFIHKIVVGPTIETERIIGDLSEPRVTGLEINPEQLPYDSTEALKIMYNALGQEFNKDCKSWDWPLSLILEQRMLGLGEGELTWKMSFSCNVPEDWESIFIDANTSEVLEIRQ